MAALDWFTRLDGREHADDDALAEAAHEALTRYRLVHFVGIEGRDEAGLRRMYEAVFERLGVVLDVREDFRQGGVRTGERWIEINYDHDIPDLAAYRHSKNAQPWHTDSAYVSNPPDVMGMYCLRQAEEGGATNFVAVEDVLGMLQSEEPELAAILEGETFHFSKVHEHRRQPVFVRRPDGRLTMNYNYYTLDASESEAHKAANQAFFDWMQRRLRDAPACLSVCMQPGEGVLWWDDYVIHGRDAFVATKTNDRFLWKTGIQVAGVSAPAR
ncbi:MAG: TauD/TfdA family dioxygenase [Alphaproteobacteria bacterium]|nr:TauD/TfdA family dioxygenase [Alphaproteobacteria bacterium]